MTTRADEPAYPVPGLMDDETFNGLSKRERAEAAVMHADALLAELSKERK